MEAMTKAGARPSAIAVRSCNDRRPPSRPDRPSPIHDRRLMHLFAVTCLAAATSAIGAASVAAQRPSLSAAARQFVRADTSLVALTNVRVIDGTGAPARDGQTIVVRDGRIVALGDASDVKPPEGALVMDLTGKSVIPGLVMVHEHLFYPTGPAVYGNLSESFTRLYLAGGVTSMRTGGNMNGLGEIGIAKAIAAAQKAGPWIDATAPYLQGPGLAGIGQMHVLKDAADARRMVTYWADEGATSYKAYMHITRAELRAAVDEAHRRGLRVTGHLCSVTYREAAELGIDDLEHGFLASTDFAPHKQPDECPAQETSSISHVDVDSEPFKALVAELVKRRVAVTSTLTVFETFAVGRPEPPGLDVLVEPLRQQFLQFRANLERATTPSPFGALLKKDMAMELAFARAGGLLIAGTDPTGAGGVVPGYSNQRQLELLVEAGFTPLEAIRIGTLNGATYLRRDSLVGSIAVGKQADLVVINGEPSRQISDVRNVELVFKQGIAYDPAKLIASVKGKVGLF